GVTQVHSIRAGGAHRHLGRRRAGRRCDAYFPFLIHLAGRSAASRHDDAGSSPLSAPSCKRTGSRSPSTASRNTERASSSGRTVVLPTALSVSHASSKAVSKMTSVWGSKDVLWNPRMVRPHRDSTDRDVTDRRSFGVKLAEFVADGINLRMPGSCARRPNRAQASHADQDMARCHTIVISH